MRINSVRYFAAAAVLLTAGAVFVAAQAPQGGTPPPPPKFKMMSSAYPEGGMIPQANSCAVPMGTSPAISWSDAPNGTMSFTVIFHDMDGAPGKNSMDVTHWIFWNIPATATSIPANVAVDATPMGIAQGKNVRGVNGFQPPCPPVGGTVHHYVFELYALDTKLDLPAGATRDQLLAAMNGHVIGKTAYGGLFGR